MKKTLIGITLLSVIILTGCSSTFCKPEKAEIDSLNKQISSMNLDLQEKCAKQSSTFFKENYTFEKKTGETWLNDYENHYNKKLNKCFIQIEQHYITSDMSTKSKALIDVFENKSLGGYSSLTKNSEEKMIDCNVENNFCKSEFEFKNLVKSYMEE